MAAAEFDGRVVLITGGARNIGRQLAEEFAAAGACVLVNARTARAELDATVGAITSAGGRAMGYVADVTDPAAVQAMVRAAVEAWGRIDILVNNAVTHAAKPFHELTFEEWHGTIAVTLDGAFHCIQACLPHMIRAGGGSIVNMGGAFGHMPVPGRAATSAAKAGLAGVTRALALEFAPHDINVNYVAPGPANTVRHVPFTMDPKRIPLGRFAEKTDVTALVRLLCSAPGRYITGQTIHVNGGLYMNS